MSQRYMLALGPFRFEVGTLAHQSLDRSRAYRWPKQDRIGRLPASQFVGPDLPAITLEGVVYPTFAGGLDQVDEMAALAAEGVPYLLVDGLGWVHGYWCITSVTDKRTTFMRDGQAKKIDFTISLQAYGEDG